MTSPEEKILFIPDPSFAVHPTPQVYPYRFHPFLLSLALSPLFSLSLLADTHPYVTYIC
jgi:hypothetical protein